MTMASLMNLLEIGGEEVQLIPIQGKILLHARDIGIALRCVSLH